MRHLLVTAFLVLVHVCWTRGECPEISQVPIMYNDDAFTCAQTWTADGSDLAIHACNNCAISGSTLPDDRDDDAGDGRHYPMGSIIVKAGCTLYMFYDENYSGDRQIHEGPLRITNNDWGHHSADESDGCDNGPRSMQCRCRQDPVSCSPDDGYNVVLFCDNTGNSHPIKCTYQQSIGTTFSDSISESMSIDESISYELQLQFFKLFSEKLGISVATGYDWKHVSEETMSEEITITVDTEAQPGTTLTIEQAVGTCEGSTAKTEMFRVTESNKRGEVLSVSYQKSSEIGKPMSERLDKSNKVQQKGIPQSAPSAV